MVPISLGCNVKGLFPTVAASIRKAPRWMVLFLLLAIGLGCSTSQPPLPDQDQEPLQSWQLLAKKARGHSPPAPRHEVPLPQRSVGASTDHARLSMPPLKRQPEKPLPTRPVTLRMHDADVAVVLRALARAVNQSILINDKVHGKVSIDVGVVPWDQAFKGVLKLQGLTYAWEGNIIRVMTIEDLENELRMEAIDQKRHAQELAIKRVEPLYTEVIPVHYTNAADLKKNLEPFLVRNDKGETRGSISVDGHTNSLIIQATRSEIEQMLPLVDKLDRPTSQILIEATIVEATREAAKELGVQWGGFYHQGDFFVTPGGYNGKVNSKGEHSYDPFHGSPGVSGNGFALNFPVSADAISAAGGVGSLGLMLGTIGGNILELQLSALESVGKVQILSTPSITTMDNQMAYTENGQKVPYVSIDEDGNREVNFENAVLRLEITPHVIDSNYLKMKILVQNDRVDFTHQVDGNPLIIKKQTETNLISQNGETIVISGLTQEGTSNTNAGVPGLKDTPLVDKLFSKEGSHRKMEEVLIFITPHILGQQHFSPSNPK